MKKKTPKQVQALIDKDILHSLEHELSGVKALDFLCEQKVKQLKQLGAKDFKVVKDYNTGVADITCSYQPIFPLKWCYIDLKLDEA